MRWLHQELRIILLFYKMFWDLIKEPFLAMLKDVTEKKRLSKSQKEAMVVFGNKPKKKGSQSEGQMENLAIKLRL